MFCQKCGNQIDDNSKFCEKCGASLVNSDNLNVETKVEDNDIILTVKPKFKFLYNSLGFIITVSIVSFFFMFPIMFVDDVIWTMIGILIIFFIPVVLIWAIAMAVKNAQYKKYTYNFYRTKVIYRDTFLNISEKEVKYKFIREIVFTQSFVQRWFNIGNVVLYTNAQSGMNNGIFLRSVENVKAVYQEVKNIVNV